MMEFEVVPGEKDDSSRGLRTHMRLISPAAKTLLCWSEWQCLWQRNTGKGVVPQPGEGLPPHTLPSVLGHGVYGLGAAAWPLAAA